MAGQIESVGELRGGHLRTLMRGRWWRIAMVGAPLAVGILAIFAIPGANPVLAFVVAVGILVLAGMVVTYFVADSRAKSSFMLAWAVTHDWKDAGGLWVEEATPLLRQGRRQRSDEHVGGQLAGAGQAVLCHFTYETEHTTTNSGGGTTTRTEKHPFTVVEVSQLQTGIRRLTLHPRGWGDNRLFDRLDSMLTSNRVVNLESSELEREYKLEVGDAESELAVRLLFEPAFMVWCIDQAAEDVVLELEDGVLVVAIPDHSYDAAQLDALVDKAATVAGRLAAAHAATPKET